MKKRLFIGLALIIWSTVIISIFYITQKPAFIQVFLGIIQTIWTITLTFIILLCTGILGNLAFRFASIKLNLHEHLILGIGLGLGILGFLGYWLAAIGLAHTLILLLILIIILGIGFKLKILYELQVGIKSLINTFQETQDIPIWLFAFVAGTAGLGFFFALLPPAEGFDGLLYHLTVPERLLIDQRIIPYDNYPFWFPAIVEGDFVWALSLGSERTAQFIHLSFAFLTVALIWEWANKTLGAKTAWWALAIIASMPSFPWLASWAYNDMALAFYGLASIYLLWKAREVSSYSHIIFCGIFAGMIMSVKYTSFIVPIYCVFLILVLKITMLERFRFVFVFSIIALLIALPWYLRNWIMVDNPFFPFVFGGRYWDIFLDQWKTNNNSGIGWNFFEILIIPINIMRGNNDQNYYDSRIGPLFLLALPLLPIVFWKHRHAPDAKSVLFVSTGYMLIYYLFWTVGVINTINLWQTRYLWPALLIFAIPLGAGLAYLTELDTQHMRTSFIVYAIISFVIGITFLDNSLYLILRHPLSYAVGIETRREYFERIQPDYAAALELVDSTPRDSYVYFIFEPRSYSMTRKVQADAPNSNLMHDYYLYKTPNAIIKNWKVIGYTHVLVYIQGLETIKGKNGESLENYLDALVQNLKLESRRGSYNLYSIP